MLLLIDIGNTATKLCCYDNGVKGVLQLKTISGGRSSEEYAYIFRGLLEQHGFEKPGGAALCSVVPEVTPSIVRALRTSFRIKPVQVTFKTKTGLRLHKDMGADRIASAVAAHTLYDGNLIVAAFGTATTLSVITEKGEYAGGAIMPGLHLSGRALADATAQLPEVELKIPKRILNKSTIDNIRTGVVMGHAGGVERIISEMTKEFNGSLKVIATGGHANLVSPFLSVVDYVNPYLTFEGLSIVYELNHKLKG